MATRQDMQAGPGVLTSRRLGIEFFSRPTLQVARDLLGRRLVRVNRGRRTSGRVVEVEAYIGGDDSACHARSGRTRRNSVLFGPPGRAYVYFTYGMHYLLNLVTEAEGFPAAVLLRALEPDEGQDLMIRRRGGRKNHGSPAWITGGPARLCRALSVDLAFNGRDVSRDERLFLEEGSPVASSLVEAGPRIGIDYANDTDRLAPWRIFVRDSPHVSVRSGTNGSRRRR